MGKSPGKWIKGLFSGKKYSKSNLSKGRDVLKSANIGDPLISTKISVSESTVDHSLISQSVPRVDASNEVDPERGVAPKSPNDEVLLLSVKDDNTQTIMNLASQEDAEKLRHEKAATKAQAAFRGYLARRAFRTLKGIIRLQALIRGHLVRRQAVATLRCVWGIVKLQALTRGRKVRCSDIGIEVQKSCNVGKLLGANSSGTNTSNWTDQQSGNAFISKLLASSPTTIPLHIHYGAGEPNSDWEWLERWTRSRFCLQPKSQGSKPKKSTVSKPQAMRGGLQTRETDQGRPKRSIRKTSSANADNGLNRSASESEKPKRNPRKVPSHVADSVQEHPQNEIEKVKHGARNVSNSTKEVSNQLEVDNEKPKRSIKKASSSTAADASDLSTSDVTDKMNDVAVAVSKQSEDDTSLTPPPSDEPVEEICDNPTPEMQPVENKGISYATQGITKELNSKDQPVSNGSQKTGQRRASLPAKIDQQENGSHSTSKVPSYMAPTESAKAKLRGQGSTRLALDVVEKNEITRRHSLPSSTNGKLTSMSPRVPKLVQAAGKGVIRTDKSLSSSRDGFDRAEWKR